MDESDKSFLEFLKFFCVTACFVILTICVFSTINERNLQESKQIVIESTLNSFTSTYNSVLECRLNFSKDHAYFNKIEDVCGPLPTLDPLFNQNT